jgi:DNA invertase Pin-like site-specific DNA recombinase
MLHLFAALAEKERALISQRARDALAAAKARGVKLGGDRGARLTAKARRAGTEALQARANERAADLAPIVAELQANGARSLRAIAAGLTEKNDCTCGAPNRAPHPSQTKAACWHNWRRA